MDLSDLMERLGSGVRRLLRTLLTLVVVLATIVVGESLPPLRGLDTFLREHEGAQQVLLGATIAMSVAGALLLALSQFLPGPRPNTGERASKSDDAPPLTRHREASRGGRGPWAQTFRGEASFSATKEAWKRGAWSYDRNWRILFAMLLGAILTTCGTFGVIIVIGPPGVKLLMGGLLLYATIRTTWAMWRA